MVKPTVSIIKADVGSLAGHTVVPKPLFTAAKAEMAAAKASGLINSYYVFNAGDDLELLMTRYKRENNEEIHELAWDTLVKALKLYGAGQDLLADAFSGNVKAMGPDCAELKEGGKCPRRGLRRGQDGASPR